MAVIALMAAVGASDARGSGRELIGNRYDSISVVRGGAAHELVDGTTIRVWFERREGYDVVRWHAGCNRFGARVKIRPRRLVTRRIEGTAMGCSDALDRQDRWLARFFGRSPRWARSGTKLRLRSGDDVIRLRRWDGPLFYKPYRSISVVRNGEPHALVEGTTIRVRFERREASDVVQWSAGCNHFGARVKIRPRRLVTGRIESTAIGCSDALNRQDGWLARFFRRDPRWVRRGADLRLRSGEDVIRLRRG